VTRNSSENTARYSSDSERSGLLDRVIENWLTSTNERQYQLPFCQVLAAEGETILYISTHGPFEKGKDIITRTASGEIRAYQLKAGDIGLGTWREIYGEIVNLVELAIEIPGNPPITDFTPYLVTNGELTAPVIEQVRVVNLTWKSRGIDKELVPIQKGELFDRFRASHGAYLPQELADFRTFLELILREGAEPAEKQKAAQLIEHILPTEPQNASVLNLSRAATSIALLTAYITSPAALKSNHWCVFEYWVLAGAYILFLIEKSPSAESSCRVSFEICEMAAEGALIAIAEETKSAQHLVQGFPLVDAYTYRARVTILLGLICALDLSLQVRQRPRRLTEFASAFVDARLKEAMCWGESAVPYFYSAMLFAEQRCNPSIAEGLGIQLIREISASNGESAEGRGLPNPYYSPEASLRLAYGIEALNDEQFTGFSYSAHSLIEFLARRWRRSALRSLWFGLTRISLVEFVPASPADWFRWESSEGVLTSDLPGEPQSWESLRDSAGTVPLEGLPAAIQSRPAFAIWFVLVYPHRFTRASAKLIEDAINGA